MMLRLIRDMPDRIAELYRLADISTDIRHAMAYWTGSYNDLRMSLISAIRRRH